MLVLHVVAYVVPSAGPDVGYLRVFSWIGQAKMTTDHIKKSNDGGRPTPMLEYDTGRHVLDGPPTKVPPPVSPRILLCLDAQEY